ncbi:MAG: hypothetical protein ABH811_01665 [archaeon]
MRDNPWIFFGPFILEYLEKNKIQENFKKRGEENLKFLDNSLESYGNYLKGKNLDHLDFVKEIFPRVSKFHLGQKFLEYLGNSFGKVGSKEEFEKIRYNTLVDFRRVINRILNDEPLYLIPKQTLEFKNFVKNYLSSAPNRNDFY